VAQKLGGNPDEKPGGDGQPSAGDLRDQRGAAPASDLTEDQALAQLSRPDISASEIVSLSKTPAAAKSRKFALALVTHPRAPRHVSVPLLRRMFTFDVMQLTLTPAVPADIKRAAEDQILLRAESLPLGEKISLAKRASGRVAAALLQGGEPQVIAPALDNSHLTEPLVVQALMKPRAPAAFFQLASEHRNWSNRREVQIALLRSEKTPLERAREFAKNFSEEFLRCTLGQDRLSALTNSF
jgi:hypothetical protein